MKKNQQCEGSMTIYSHSKQISFFQLFDSEGTPDITSYLCDKCVEQDLKRGFDWRLVCKPLQEPSI
jgi:hypothetical protein